MIGKEGHHGLASEVFDYMVATKRSIQQRQTWKAKGFRTARYHWVQFHEFVHRLQYIERTLFWSLCPNNLASNSKLVGFF